MRSGTRPGAGPGSARSLLRIAGPACYPAGRSLANLFARRAFTPSGLAGPSGWTSCSLPCCAGTAGAIRGRPAGRARLRLVCRGDGRRCREAADDLLNEFRYARDLITAAEAEAWLQGVGLTGAELSAYFERRVLLARWRPDLPAIMAAHPVSAGDIADALASEGICSGAFDRFALALAGRAAVFERVVTDGDAGVGPVALPVPRAAALPALLAEHAEVLQGHPAAACLPRLPHLAAIDAAFELMVPRITESAMRPASPPAASIGCASASSVLPFHRSRWHARPCCAAARTASRSASSPPTSTAASIGRTCCSKTCDPDVQAAVLSAAPGQIIGPLQIGDMHHVLVVRSKQVPVLEDPEVRARAERALRESLLDRERNARVRWGVRS